MKVKIKIVEGGLIDVSEFIFKLDILRIYLSLRISGHIGNDLPFEEYFVYQASYFETLEKIHNEPYHFAYLPTL